MITAPYNFVPLNDKVFYPSWADDVSHDVPFEDGESGCIDITITAKSPIFVRDHENKEQFCNHRGQYYIPGSSVKGMVRNVLEIMSFGKLKLDTKKHTKITSVRDMTDQRKLVGTAQGCGFLKKDENNNWVIIDYGKPRVIRYDDESNKTINNGQEIINCDFITAKDKYDTNNMYKEIRVERDTKKLIDKEGNNIGNQDIARISLRGEEAYLIFTGGIENKKNEFVFVSGDKKDNIIKNIDEAVKKFKQVYFESDSIDGDFWKKNCDENIGIPIFYIKDKGNKVTNIGLTQLFKLAYDYTIYDATNQVIETMTKKVNQDDKERKYNKLDLAEAIFGAIQEEIVDDDKIQKVNCALKGRVQFSHFKCDSSPVEYERVTTVLGSPNASFYPQYIQQNCKDDGKVENNKYKTLMDKFSKISGWKRYPLRYGKPKFIKAEEGTDSATTFTPIGTYSGNDFNEFTFSGKLRYHNLKKAELGAIISALTFHNHEDTFYHNIGMAKSLGFGKIKISLETSNYIECLEEYEILISKWVKEKVQKEWLQTDQIKELFSMSYKNLNIDDKLKYLKLDPDKKINEFVDAKSEKIKKEYVGKDCFPKVSQMFDIGDNYPKSLLTTESLERREKIKQEEKEKELYTRKLDEVLKTKNIQIIENFIKNYPEDENVEKLKINIKSINDSLQDNKFTKINANVKSAYEVLLKKKGTKSFQKDKENFIKKWEAKKNNKDSKVALEYVEKAKELK